MTSKSNTEGPLRESPETINHLRKLFQYYGDTQSEFGERFDLDQGYLSNIMNGWRQLPSSILKSMAYQNIDIHWGLTGEREMFLSRGKTVTNLDLHEVSERIAAQLKGPLVKD